MQRVAATALLVAAGFGLAYASHAQFSTEPLALTLYPDYPRPYQTVTIVPESSAIDLTGSRVTATVNGASVSDGSGAEPIYVTLGGPGSVTTVTVRATTGGQTYTKTLTIRPADVALVVESQSSAHPFYEGGHLVASEGALRIVAHPDLRTSSGAVLPASSLVYTWRNGEQILQGASGIGKYVLAAAAPVMHRDARITVTVTNQDQSIVAQAATVIAPSEPLIRIYRNDPLLGPFYGTALPKSTDLGGEEESFRAVPYFFGQTPAITWQVNRVANDTDRDITVRAVGAGRGEALLSVVATAPGAVETANTSLSIEFGENTGFNLFGL
jgi:ribosomal protein L31